MTLCDSEGNHDLFSSDGTDYNYIFGPVLFGQIPPALWIRAEVLSLATLQRFKEPIEPV